MVEGTCASHRKGPQYHQSRLHQGKDTCHHRRDAAPHQIRIGRYREDISQLKKAVYLTALSVLALHLEARIIKHALTRMIFSRSFVGIYTTPKPQPQS